MVLGEDSAHARLQDLLRHYTACPLSPYGEMLTEPLIRQVRPAPSPREPGCSSRLLILACHPAIGPLSALCPQESLRQGYVLGEGSSRDQDRHMWSFVFSSKDYLRAPGRPWN